MILKVYIHQSTSQRVSRLQNLVIKKFWPPTLRPLCIAVTSRASKLQVSKVGELRDLNPDLLRESLNIGKLTYTGGPGSNAGQADFWRLVTLKPLKLQQCTLHFWKPLIFFYLDKRGQERSLMFSLWYAIRNTHRYTS